MKHYEGGRYWTNVRVDKIVSIRLSYEQQRIIEKYFPGKSVSFAIRTMIHKYDQVNCNTK